MTGLVEEEERGSSEEVDEVEEGEGREESGERRGVEEDGEEGRGEALVSAEGETGEEEEEDDGEAVEKEAFRPQEGRKAVRRSRVALFFTAFIIEKKALRTKE